MTNSDEQVTVFFQRYRDALLARDAKAIAGMYAVPSLVVFPQQLLAVTSQQQTEQFFASSFGQYDGVNDAQPAISIMGEAPAVIWADVTWSYDGQPRERFCYQLAEDEAGEYQIVVLTPMELG